MDSFIFDDDIEEIGSDVEAFCPKCKADTAHTIITKYEDEIRRVQCSSCGEIHIYRKPRGDAEEEGEAPEPPSIKKRTGPKKLTWEEFFKKHSSAGGRPYSFRDTYVESDIVHHPKFGVGFASEVMGDDKVEITFPDQRRVLVHNRKALPGAPPELARPPQPRRTAKEEKRFAKARAAEKAQAAKQAAAAAKAAAKQPAKGGKAVAAARGAKPTPIARATKPTTARGAGSQRGSAAPGGREQAGAKRKAVIKQVHRGSTKRAAAHASSIRPKSKPKSKQTAKTGRPSASAARRSGRAKSKRRR